jgi:hypothetical protein
MGTTSPNEGFGRRFSKPLKEQNASHTTEASSLFRQESARGHNSILEPRVLGVGMLATDQERKRQIEQNISSVTMNMSAKSVTYRIMFA